MDNMHTSPLFIFKPAYSRIKELLTIKIRLKWPDVEIIILNLQNMSTRHSSQSEYEVLSIRRATAADMPQILKLVAGAKKYMRSKGNLTQWAGPYPSHDDIMRDIDNGNFYVICDEKGHLFMCFAFIIGKDPFYGSIRDGEWIDDTKPYGTIHRMASSGEIPRLSDLAFAWCFTRIGNLRVDTHADNATMLMAIERSGFKRCGIVKMGDGTHRTSFQKMA